ncbi:hypothetical protein AB0J30_34295 [Streptomyces microflavus]|uniref:DinB/UmuC family translesion DNA polymerase n=1 Tax=Streptomyces microflavus TaxID=1919 RepID=UPI003445FAEB
MERVRPRRHPQRRRPPARTSKRSCTRGRWGSCTASAPPRPTPRPRSASTPSASSPPSRNRPSSASSAAAPDASSTNEPRASTAAPSSPPTSPPLPYSTSAQRRFTIDTLDPTAVRAALLSLAVELGDRLRNRQQATRTVTLTVTLGGHSQITRSHRLESGPSAHTDDLRQTLYDLYADCGSQRARIRAVTGG